MELLLIRHGEAAPPPEGGVPDYPLTPKGREQARLLAQRLAAAPPDVLYASTVLRARETAEIVSERLGKPIVFERGFREIDTGTLMGISREERKRRHPELFIDGVLRLDFTAFQGEGSTQFGERCAATIRQVLMDRHAASDERIAVIAHGGFINASLAFFLGIPFDGVMRFGVENTSVTTLRVRPNRCLVIAANDHAHLAPLAAWADEKPPTYNPGG